MQTHRLFLPRALWGMIAGMIALALAITVGAHAQTLNTLYTFAGGPGGANPAGHLVLDASGNLYGVTSNGGMVTGNCSSGCGTVFELTPNGSGWSQSVIYTFTGANGDGFNPIALAARPSGILYGVTTWGGSSTLGNCGPAACGTVFELTQGAAGWTEKILYNFQGGTHDGAFPFTNLLIDSHGNLYGTTAEGGIGDAGCYGDGCGTVWELSPTASGVWKETLIHNFLGRTYGAFPRGLTMDSAGNLYGATNYGGNAQRGTVYKLSPTKNGWIGGVIFRMPANTYLPSGIVAVDSHGNIFGSTAAPGSYVYELTPTSSGWTQQIIHTFPQNGGYAISGMTIDAKGNVYGTSTDSVFELETVSGSLQLVTLATFSGDNSPADPGLPTFDANGNLYGVAFGGLGTDKDGAVYEITP
jgi:uncharacterized repeat protein (TIGR03803 family)